MTGECNGNYKTMGICLASKLAPWGILLLSMMAIDRFTDTQSQTFTLERYTLWIIALLVFFKELYTMWTTKLMYNDTSILYRGYDKGIFPKSVNADISIDDIAEAKTYFNDKTEMLSIKTINGEKMKLCINYFLMDDIIGLLQKLLLARSSATPVDNAEAFRVNIDITKLSNPQISLNGECLHTDKEAIGLDVKSGDLLSVRHEHGMHMVRLYHTCDRNLSFC